MRPDERRATLFTAGREHLCKLDVCGFRLVGDESHDERSVHRCHPRLARDRVVSGRCVHARRAARVGRQLHVDQRHDRHVQLGHHHELVGRHRAGHQRHRHDLHHQSRRVVHRHVQPAHVADVHEQHQRLRPPGRRRLRQQHGHFQPRARQPHAEKRRHRVDRPIAPLEFRRRFQSLWQRHAERRRPDANRRQLQPVGRCRKPHGKSAGKFTVLFRQRHCDEHQHALRRSDERQHRQYQRAQVWYSRRRQCSVSDQWRHDDADWFGSHHDRRTWGRHGADHLGRVLACGSTRRRPAGARPSGQHLGVAGCARWHGHECGHSERRPGRAECGFDGRSDTVRRLVHAVG